MCIYIQLYMGETIFDCLAWLSCFRLFIRKSYYFFLYSKNNWETFSLNDGIPSANVQMSSDRWCADVLNILQMAVQKVKVLDQDQ